MIKRHVYWLMLLTIPLMSACGGKPGAPESSVITFNPAALTWTNINASSACYYGLPQLQQIVIKTPAGAPLNDTALTVFVDSNFALLYDDLNDNLILDPEEMTPISGGSLNTKTKTFGTKNVFVSAKLGGTACTGTTKGLAYTMAISVYSGNNYGVATYTITSQ